MKRTLRAWTSRTLILCAALVLACGQPAATPSSSNSASTGSGSGAAGATGAGASAPAEATGPATLVVYTALEEDQINAYTSVFQKRYPNIKLEMVRESTGVITAKFLAEKENPRADVIWGIAATSLLVADEMGLLKPYAPNGLERVDSTFRDKRTPPRWVGIDVWESAFCVNTIELKAKNLPMPTSWQDLTNPVYKGHIVMPNPASSGTGYLSISSWIQLMGEENAWKYMDGLHQNIAAYQHSGSKPCRVAGTGEYPIGISFGYRGVAQKLRGEPLEIVWPKEGAGWDLEANALVKKATIKPEAKTFLNWAISDEIMREYAKNYPMTTVKTDVPIPQGYLTEPLKQLAKNDLIWAARERERVLKQWAGRYDGKSEPK
ncbi:MAG TPA: putative 2-aminoethylphosphonate ABC transporter substrate-binding protein [Chloroflexota bacterium]|nr:putative 2-aminoethylphosphonate ABC transporter substrate-binding protein [Chloroflexota bacterium]